MSRLWTSTVHYGASGEGETLMAWIGYAQNAEQTQAELSKVFNEFHGAFAESSAGVVRNQVTKILFSETVLKRIEGLDGRATVNAHATLHFNLA